MAIVLALVCSAVGLALGWAIGRGRARRQDQAAPGTRAEVMGLEVRRLEGRTAELDALLDVAGQERARLHDELAAACGDRAALTAEVTGLGQERAALEESLVREREGRAADSAAHTAAARARAEESARQAGELESARDRARDAEAAVEALGARLTARDAALTQLQQQVVALEAAAGRPPPEPDDLRMVDGVGRVLEGMLHEAGITTYRHLAELSAEASPDAQLEEFLHRIRQEEWSAQADELHRRKHGEAGEQAS